MAFLFRILPYLLHCSLSHNISRVRIASCCTDAFYMRLLLITVAGDFRTSAVACSPLRSAPPYAIFSKLFPHACPLGGRTPVHSGTEIWIGIFHWDVERQRAINLRAATEIY